MTEPLILALSDGRDAAVHVAGSPSPAAPVLVLHYGTPHTGRHPARIAAVAEECGLRLVSVVRPGYPGTPRRPGRSVADSARDVAEVLDRLGIDAAATAGYSGGGPHALALAALLPSVVREVGVVAGLAPYDGTPSWFEGMADGGAALRAATQGREAREEHQRVAEFDPAIFTETDEAALAGTWAGIGQDAQAASGAGSDDGEVNDDLAFVAPWGVDLGRITAPVTLVQGSADRIVPASHAHRLAALLPGATLRITEGAGHVAVLDDLPGWIRGLVRG